MTKGQHTLDKVMVDVPGGAERDGVRFHHTTQNGMQFRTYEFFISEIKNLISFSIFGLQFTVDN